MKLQESMIRPYARFRKVIKACQFAGALLLYAAIQSAIAKEVTQIRHYDKGYSPLLRVYLIEVLEAALDKTASEFGPYELSFYSRHLSSNRSKLEAERGALLDLLFSTHWRGRFVNPDNMIRIEYPIFEGMLGLRSLIVTQEQYERFSRIRSRQELLRFSAGQGSSWTDVDVLKANQIEVKEAQLFDGLFSMLSKHRYDYLPLSILEAQAEVEAKRVQHNNIIVNNDIYLFYPMPLYLYVNAKRPELAERLAKGLEIALDDGTIEKLFAQHFHHIKPILEGGPKSLLVLKNPLMSERENEDVLRRFLERYQRAFHLLPDS